MLLLGKTSSSECDRLQGEGPTTCQKLWISLLKVTVGLIQQAITKEQIKTDQIDRKFGKKWGETTKEVNLLLALVLKLKLPIRSARGGSVPRAWQQREAAGAAGAPQQRRRRGPAQWRLSPQRRGLAAQELPGGDARAATHPQTLHRPPQDRRWEQTPPTRLALLLPARIISLSVKKPFVMSLGEADASLIIPDPSLSASGGLCLCLCANKKKVRLRLQF